MIEQIKTNIFINLKFITRKNLILSIIFLAVAFLPLFYGFLAIIVKDIKFYTEGLLSIFYFSTQIINVLILIFAITYFPYHISKRNTTVMFTKNCPIEIYILTYFATLKIINFLLLLFASLFTYILSFYYTGMDLTQIVFIMLNSFIVNMILICVAIFVSIWIKKDVLTFIIILFCSNQFLFSLYTLFNAIPSNASLFSHIMKYFTGLIYFIMPVSNPFGDKISNITSIGISDWKYLLFTFIYAFFIIIFFQCASYLIIKTRKNLTA